MRLHTHGGNFACTMLYKMCLNCAQSNKVARAVDELERKTEDNFRFGTWEGKEATKVT